MNFHHGGVKEEFMGGSSSFCVVGDPQPMEGLHENGPPPFLTKTYDIVDDPSTNHIVSWSRGNNSFGFKKVDPDSWEFANEMFLRGQKILLKNIIRRRKTDQSQAMQQQTLDPSCVEVRRFGLDGIEIDRLRRDRQVLMVELVKLRQQQQNTRTYLEAMEGRLKRTEHKQKQMMNFLVRAIENPNFLQQLVEQKEWRKELEEVFSKKRRRNIDQGHSNVEVGDVEEHANLMNQLDIRDKEIDVEVFWQDLFKDDIEDEVDVEDVDVLIEQLGYLASSLPN
ncbi:hypothetical protein TSUD_45690 [Trifolium subterraneum]|nr:hypothetical protein TSUD_45690 [Trifolium subterraneum]